MQMHKPDTDDLRTLIRLAAAGARGEPPEMTGVQWSRILPVAVGQGALKLVASAVRYWPDADCPDSMREYLLDGLRNAGSVNLLRKHRTLYLIAKLCKSGIDVRVLKGLAIADLYACPESRDSLDSDLLIDPKDEKKALWLLEEEGFKITPRALTSNHSICQHERFGDVELHVAPYDELTEENWFRGVDAAALIREEPVTVDTPDGSYRTLGPTDDLIFITLHMVKHFINNGLSIQMMLDIALFCARNRDRIDQRRFRETIEGLGYRTLVDSVLRIMIVYGGFSKSDFPGCCEVGGDKIELLLEDLLRGGFKGSGELDARLASGVEYNREIMLKRKSKAGFWLYMIRYKARGARKTMYPAREKMVELYPVIGKCPALTPVFYAYRTIAYPVKRLREGTLRHDVFVDAEKMAPETQRRLGMFREMGML